MPKETLMEFYQMSSPGATHAPGGGGGMAAHGTARNGTLAAAPALTRAGFVWYRAKHCNMAPSMKNKTR